ncbi:MAG: inorganic diphosphatase, partial [Pseudomonadota bacterium]
DRFMGTAMHYPCNYGYIPQTLSEDGDPADVLVVTPIPVISGSVIRVRPLGMLNMTDEAGKDAKIIAVPIDKLSNRYSAMNSVRDLSKGLLDSISHFFDHYKDLEPGKWVKIDGWGDVEDAKREIIECVERYNIENK